MMLWRCSIFIHQIKTYVLIMKMKNYYKRILVYESIIYCRRYQKLLIICDYLVLPMKYPEIYVKMLCGTIVNKQT
jgi:hypothetical protein